jgi:hypothetical protein
MPAEVVPFRLTAPPTELPPEILIRALHQISRPTEAQLRAADKLAEELDLLHRGRPTPAGLWLAMVWALITELERAGA